MHKFLELLIKKILDPLILWCFGWKKKKELYAGAYRTLWQDPKTKHWLSQDAAIFICTTYNAKGK